MDKFGIPSASKHTWVEIMEVWIDMIDDPAATKADKNFAITRLTLLAAILDEMDNAKKD